MTEQEEIQMCLNCPLPDCVNCLGKHTPPASRIRVKRLLEVKRMAELGLTDREMGKILGVHMNTILEMRKALGIPNLRTRRIEVRGGVA